MAAAPPFDDRDGWIWLDGALVPWRDAKIHVLTHGLHYGSSVFEGERVYNGKVFKLSDHSHRLVRSAEILGMDMPYGVDQIDAATMETVRANGITDGYVRPVAWRGSEMMGVAAQSTRTRLAIAVWTWPSYFSPEARMKGIRLSISDWRRPDPRTAPSQAKAAGLYMICTMSKHKAEADGFDDCLMLDYRGQVAEATGANIFFVIDGALHTPLPDCFLDGITRRTVIDLARKRGMTVVERAIFPAEIGRASECFLTGTAAEITPVSQIAGCAFRPGTVSEALISDYSNLVKL